MDCLTLFFLVFMRQVDFWFKRKYNLHFEQKTHGKVLHAFAPSPLSTPFGVVIH